MAGLITLIVRVAQILFAAAVLAISAIVIKDFGPGKAPALHGYGAFCGGAGLLIALIGVAAAFVEALQGVVMLVLDGVATLFLLAGGIAFAAVLKVGSCTDQLYLSEHVNPFAPGDDRLSRFTKQRQVLDSLTYRCRMSQADTAMIWLLFATFAASLVLHFTSKHSRGASFV